MPRRSCNIMKNKILMISTFFLSFVILISSVNAAQELTCTYEDASEPNDSLGIVYKKRIIQYEDGTIKYQYFADSGIAVSHLYNWKNSDNPNTSFKDTSAYDKNSGLKECPQCVTWKNNYNKPDNDKFHFKDANKEGNCKVNNLRRSCRGYPTIILGHIPARAIFHIPLGIN